MKKYLKNIIYILTVSAFTHCSKEANLKSEFELQKQVVNCLFRNGDNFYVYTTLTGTPVDSNIIAVDSNSVVILYEDNVQKEIIPYSRVGAVYKSATLAKPGSRYKLEVREPAFANDARYQLDAFASLPDSINLLNCFFKDSIKQDAFGNWMGQIHFELADNREMVNPEIKLEYYDAQTFGYSPVVNFIPDNNWNKYTSSSIATAVYTIANGDWNGATMSFDLYVNSIDYHNQGITQFKLSIANLSADWRSYQSSLSAYLKAGGSDQLKVYSNVLGEGYGIFAGKFVKSIVIK